MFEITTSAIECLQYLCILSTLGVLLKTYQLINEHLNRCKGVKRWKK